MIRCPTCCWSVRFEVAEEEDEELGGVVGGALDDEEDDEEDEDDDEVVLGVDVDEEVDGGVVDELDELPLADVFDPLLEHAPLSNPTAASSANPAAPPVFLLRPVRIPASAMLSTLAKAAARCQPDGPFRCLPADGRTMHRPCTGLDTRHPGGSPKRPRTGYDACKARAAGAGTNSTARIRSARRGEAGARITSSAVVRSASRSM